MVFVIVNEVVMIVNEVIVMVGCMRACYKRVRYVTNNEAARRLSV